MIKTAFLYPGQGAVPAAPLNGTFSSHPGVSRSYEELMPDFLPGLSDFHQGEKLNDFRAQAGVHALSVGIGRALMEAGVKPAMVTGYSSGLYAAMSGCGSCPPETGAAIVRQAYELLQDTPFPEEYQMAAVIGLLREEVEEIAASLEPRGWVSIVNNQRQILVGIPCSHGQAFQEIAFQEGALKVVSLPFECAYHVPPMQDAAEALVRRIRGMDIGDPVVPFFGGPQQTFLNSAEEVAQAVGMQLALPVDWKSTITGMIDEGVELFISLDPTRTMENIVRWITRSVPIRTVARGDDIEELAGLFKNS